MHYPTQKTIFEGTVLLSAYPYTTFPGIVGVANDKLPKGTRTLAKEMKSVLNESHAKDIPGLLSKVRELESNLNNISKDCPL